MRMVAWCSYKRATPTVLVNAAWGNAVTLQAGSVWNASGSALIDVAAVRSHKYAARVSVIP